MNKVQTRASKAARWIKCPVSATLEPKHKRPQTPAALEGTVAHKLAESWLRGEEYDHELINDEMKGYVNQYCDYVKSLGHVYGIEESVSLHWPHLTPGIITGTLDSFCISEDGDILFVNDFKYGFKDVEVYENWQLIVYAFGTMNQIIKFFEPSIIVMNIIQPRLFVESRRFKSWRVTRDEMQNYGNVLYKALCEANMPNPVCVTGDHCQWCDGLMHCSAGLNAAGNAIDVTQQSLPVVTDGRTMARVLDTLSAAERMIKSLKIAATTEAEALIDKNHIIPGYEMKRKVGRRKFGNIKKLLKDVHTCGKTTKDLIKVDFISPREAEKRNVPKNMIKKHAETPLRNPELVKSKGNVEADKLFKQAERKTND